VPFKTKIILNENDLNKYSQFLDQCFIQEYLDEKYFDQIDIGGFFTGEKQSLICFKEMNQFPRGVASYVTRFSSNGSLMLIQNITNFLNEINFRGFIELEFKRNIETDKFILMDLNPRPWGCLYYYISSVKNLHDVIYFNKTPIDRKSVV